MKITEITYTIAETIPNKHKQYANMKPEVTVKVQVDGEQELPQAWEYAKATAQGLLDDAAGMTHRVMQAESVGQRPLNQVTTPPTQPVSTVAAEAHPAAPVSADQPITINPPAYNNG